MKTLVTGGGGFLGTEICRMLCEAGHEVHSLSRAAHPHLVELGVQTRCADLADTQALRTAVEGCETVFHVAAKAGVWGKAADYYRTNVTGTLNLIQACQDVGVPRLVYTSSPAVCFDGSDHLDADNHLPLATSFLAPYPETKAIAEKAVLQANSSSLSTCALRPHLIFGPGDPHLLPRLVATARAGKLAQVGDGKNVVSMCYVTNAAHGHVLAAESLSPTSAHAGQAYFIAQEEPVVLWSWIAELLEELGVGAPRKTISRRTAYTLGALLELAWRTLYLPGEPRMTRFVANQLASSHSYSMEPARLAFGYRELVGLQEATARAVAWLRPRD